MKHWKIIEKRNLWFAISGLVILLGFAMMGMRAVRSQPMLNLGSDFAGGNTMVLRFDWLNEKYKQIGHNPEAFQEESGKFIGSIRDVLSPFGLENSSIQISNDQEVIIKTAKVTQDKSAHIREALTARLGPIEVLEIDYIGPAMGAELRNQSVMIIIMVSVALMAYISWRFEFCYGVGALAATLHDALLMISLASIFHIEVDTAFVAALLTILGYSINDTIVIFDRVRDNISKARTAKHGFDLATILNISIRETLGRTINTVATVVIVLAALLAFGGSTLRAFCAVLLMGTIAGTYSSIFIAGPVMASAFKQK
ncbi:protein translocase subunit SecF [bacterium]|nr:protein translocase subunit SecF [bacterium]